MDDRLLDTRYCDVRSRTEALAAPLSAEDQTVQSMPDVSPTKWHRAHTTWFFERFVLADTELAQPYDPAFDFLFNSYYEQVGPRYERSRRGHVARPGAEEIGRYRRDVDTRMRQLLAGDLDERHGGLVVLGLHHEQQHQELLLMDIKHVLSQHPQPVAYAARPHDAAPRARDAGPPRQIEGGIREVGATASGFCFDNELPRHRCLVEPATLDARLVRCDEYVAFIDDGGYSRPELWLSEGWAMLNALGWQAPLYWSNDDGGWRRFTLFGTEDVRADDPVTHVSYFEADAFARWRGARLPTEFEWEVAASGSGTAAPFGLEPPSTASGDGFFGSVWQWTQSAYAPYPGFRVAPGAVGEYNGKFMVNQQVLRGGASITPEGHTRPTYRNFYPASARWPYTGLRLAHDTR
ncbi:MAG TPA: ergothioneine biosynthesis protein EgtB [Acidimicrobiales bacterium]|jgi:ergothioneine biosynthesis protein EgtB|nr:ergothioneine biosynthesis protein EgtB [Acidimicrobiales bacterium]